MTNSQMLSELRAMTSAGMFDCKRALEETNWDLNKAVDVIKMRGLNIASNLTGRATNEGKISIVCSSHRFGAMVEVNSETDFVSKSWQFDGFVNNCALTLLETMKNNGTFSEALVEDARQKLASTTKENIVVRRWFGEEALRPDVCVFSYLHSNSKIGVLLSLQAPSETMVNHEQFQRLGDDMSMQIAAMNPIAVSRDRISPADLERQKNIFESQLKELNKPQISWDKIVEGKFRKWFSEVCLVEQESVIVPKKSIDQVMQEVGEKLGGEIKVVNFARCQVGA